MTVIKKVKLKITDVSDVRSIDTLLGLDDKTLDLIVEKMGIPSVRLINALNTVAAMSRVLGRVRREDREKQR